MITIVKVTRWIFSVNEDRVVQQGFALSVDGVELVFINSRLVDNPMEFLSRRWYFVKTRRDIPPIAFYFHFRVMAMAMNIVCTRRKGKKKKKSYNNKKIKYKYIDKKKSVKDSTGGMSLVVWHIHVDNRFFMRLFYSSLIHKREVSNRCVSCESCAWYWPPWQCIYKYIYI